MKQLKGIPTFLLAIKFVFTTGYRCLYPLASIVALRYDSITTANVAVVLAFMQFVNMFGSFLSTSAQNVMGMSKLICVCLFAEACLTLMMAFSTTFYILATAIILLGVTKGFLFPTILAFTNSLFNKEVQGVTIGYIEIAWGLSSLVGMPIVGLTMNIDFRLPFVCLAILCTLLCMFGFYFFKSRNLWHMNGHEDAGATKDSEASVQDVVVSNDADIFEREEHGLDRLGVLHDLYHIIHSIFHTPLAFSIVTSTITTMMSMYVMFLSFGIWLVQTHGYNAAEVGAATLTVGAADLLAEFSLIKILKHFEHVKFLVVAQTCLMCSYFFLAFALRPGSNIAIGLGAVFCTFYFFEMIIVGQMGLIGRVRLHVQSGDDKGNGTFPAANFICSALGCVIGSLLGPVVWNYGNSGPGIVGFATSLLNFSIWIIYYRRHGQDKNIVKA